MSAGMLSPSESPYGAQVRAVFTKWDGAPHWEYDLVLLGVDSYGVWVGGAPGVALRRPGMHLVADMHWVCLYPHDGWFVVTVNDAGGMFRSRVYIDVSTQPSWWHRPDGVLEVSAVDLDLDVIERFDGEVYVDDEDEFERHRVEHGYPDDVVDAAVSTTRTLLAALHAGDEPFHAVANGWLDISRERVVVDPRGRPVVAEPGAGSAPEDVAGSRQAPWTSADGARGDLGEVSVTQQEGAWSRTDAEDDLLAVWQRSDVIDGLDGGDGLDDGLDGAGDDGGAGAHGGGRAWGEAERADDAESSEGVDDASAVEVEHDSLFVGDIDTSPVDPSEVTGVLVTTSTAHATPLWFDGRPVEPGELGIPPVLADHLLDWVDRWQRDFDPDRGWQPRAGIADFEALGRWLSRQVKDVLDPVTVTLQLAHLGRSSLTEVPSRSQREPLVVALHPGAAGLPVTGDIVTLEGVVGCFSSEVNTRLAAWADDDGLDDAEADRLRALMAAELGPDYRVR